MPRPEDIQDRDFYPAGDMPPEEEEAAEAVVDDPGNTGQPAEYPAADAGKQEPGSDWEERYKNLEKKLGEQGNEMGVLRQQNQELQQALGQMKQSQSPEGQEQAADLQGQLQALRKQVDEGDLSPEDAMFQTASIVSEMTKMEAKQEAEQQIQKFQQDTEAEKVLSRFHEQHPDFENLRQTGTLDEVKQSLPGLHDDFSAYYAYKAKVAADEGYQRGKKEMEELAKGDEAAGKVLSKPGATIRQTNQKPLTSEKDVKSSMMDRLKASRQQG